MQGSAAASDIRRDEGRGTRDATALRETYHPSPITHHALPLLLGHAEVREHRFRVSVVLLELLPELGAGSEVVDPESFLEVALPFRRLDYLAQRAFPVGNLRSGQSARREDGAPWTVYQLHALFAPRGDGGERAGNPLGGSHRDQAQGARGKVRHCDAGGRGGE